MIGDMDYASLVTRHGHSPDAVRMSADGQQFRFAKLLEVGDLSGCSVLDLGCGCGDFYPVLTGRYPDADYEGMDIVGGMVETARSAYPSGRFSQRDVLADGIGRTYDYILMSALFNDPLPDPPGFLRAVVSLAFDSATVGIGFNFISSHVGHVDDGLAYHNPAQVLDFVINDLTWRVTMEHHYERCDVAVFAYH